MDFIQENITTIHDFLMDEGKISSRLEKSMRKRPMTLLIPMLHEEIYGESIERIIEEVNRSTYLTNVIIALAAGDEEKYLEVKHFLSRLTIPHLIIWCNGPAVEQVLEDLKERGLDITSFSGKGKDTWIALGVASLDSYAIAMHDADIVSYSKSLLSKLFYPVVEPDLDFVFNKGYYSRIDMDRRIMYGRVFRLMLDPLLNSLFEKVDGKSRFLQYLCAFRYPLAGEFSMTSDMALNVRIPGDWGLEIGFLSEVYRNTAIKRICQIDLGFYEHKHRPITNDPEEGILKMVHEITKTIFRNLEEMESIDLTEAFLRGLCVLYDRKAQDRIRQFHADTLCNDLHYNRHLEECMVEEFSDIILSAGKDYMKDPAGLLLPDWKRAISAMSDVRERIESAARDDFKRK